MGPLELLWAVLIAVFAVVGVVRGYPKELGVTTTILAALLLLTRGGQSILGLLDAYLVNYVNSSAILEGQYSDLIQSLFYVLVFVLVVVISYHGETLAFDGTPPKGPLGMALNLISGLLNGYLISGTMWYYLHIFNYPVQVLGLFRPPLTEFAQAYLVPLIPVPLLEPYLLFLVPFMIVMRVLR
ncbi:MAG: hypothetical protein CEE40_02525 [Chloroflexi bacterium B3_Chlor]|nr:MAG: hypothetical protein CEE40_02525 [Chloroflexi bacterium B3_Chlor]